MGSQQDDRSSLALANAAHYNAQLDEHLRSTGVVDSALFRDFAAVHDDPNASSVGWLTAKLKVLAMRVEAGELLSLYEPQIKDLRPASTRAELLDWSARYFPIVDWNR